MDILCQWNVMFIIKQISKKVMRKSKDNSATSKNKVNQTKIINVRPRWNTNLTGWKFKELTEYISLPSLWHLKVKFLPCWLSSKWCTPTLPSIDPTYSKYIVSFNNPNINLDLQLNNCTGKRFRKIRRHVHINFINQRYKVDNLGK